LEQQVLPAARRFEVLGLRVNREIEPIEPVSSLARTPRVDGVQDNGDLDYAAGNDDADRTDADRTAADHTVADHSVAERNPADEPGPETA
jgi:hypothetical protein